MNLKFILCIMVFLFASDISHSALAYLDPGTGSMILQLLLGGVAGALAIGKLYWGSLKDFFNKKKKDPIVPGEENK
jgi:hypothetical protein